jgi:aspartyl-tRNA(Asn)/glutamyl-tRNA(Gln) amidotransferase subunit A
MTDLTSLTISEARDKLQAKEFTATELTEAYLGAIEGANEAINAYVTVTPEKAREMAKASDERLAAGKAGALEGIPLGVKDLFATRDIHTQACSHVLDGFKPKYESTATQNLWDDGAVLLGKLNMDEFAMGSSNESSYYGAVVNPWRENGSDKKLVPGGSSGGSAAAVAARLCAGATATDTGGSIRQPAAFTGTVGIKPTYGRVSRWGIAAYASSLDQAGPIARDVRDAAILLKSMASVDKKDTTSVDLPVPDYEQAIGQSLKDAGAEVVDISLPHTKYALPAYYIVAPAEASSNLARYDGVRYGLRVDGKDIADMYEKSRAAGFGSEVKRRIMVGTYVLSAGYYDAYYLKAQKVRTLIKRDFEESFHAGVDAILAPITPSSAFAIGDEELASDPVKMYLQDVFTITVNMAGLPALSVPAGLDGKGLPLGLQLIGKPFDEDTLFKTAHVIEQAAGKFTPAKWW